MARNPILQSLFFVVMLAFCLSAPAGATKEEWPPISPEDLALKGVPEAPGAHAIILYRESFSNSLDSSETHYFRIKIFDEEGKGRGDVEIPFVQDVFFVQDIRARTIRPDGSVSNWDGKTFQRVAVKATGLKVLVKAFTLPEISPGCIIEYKYRLQFSFLLNTFWSVQDEIFTRRARFTVRPLNRGPAMRCRYFFLPSNAKFGHQPDGTFGGEVADIPALRIEDHMPPERESNARVEFYYTWIQGETPEQYWKRIGQQYYEYIQKFVNKSKAAERVVAETVSPGDSPDVKLRKLYLRTQKIRNLSYERDKSEKEEKREKIKPIENIDDALKRGYAYSNEINWVFLGLAQAAGFEASALFLASRADFFSRPELPDVRQFPVSAIWVHVGDKELYFDPSSKFCPYGLLPWQETAAHGIRVTKEGSVNITTPQPHAADGRLERKADLALLPDGTVEGKVQLSFFGQQALVRRINSRNEDDTERRKDLEAEIKNWVPSGATYEVTSSTGWDGTGEPLRAEYKITVPGLATSTGRRLLLPLAVNVAGEQNPFPHARRANAVYFHYPWEEVDEITIHLPSGYQVESIPAGRKNESGFSTYELSASQQAATLLVRRRMAMERLFFELPIYPILQAFFNEVASGDQDRAVLQSSGATLLSSSLP